MSIGVHPDSNGNLTLTVPGSSSGGMEFDDPHEHGHYAGPFTPLGTPPEVAARVVSDGAFSSLFHLPSPGMAVDLAVYYNSCSGYHGPLGYRWTHSASLLLQVSLDIPTVVTLQRGNGRTDSYVDTGCGVYEPHPEFSPDLLSTSWMQYGRSAEAS